MDRVIGLDKGPGVTPEPEWFAKTEEEKVRHTYWTTTGRSRRQSVVSKLRARFAKKQAPAREAWVVVFHSKDEAEIHSMLPSDLWEWDRQPARPVRLSEAMFHARSEGLAGVMCEGLRDGEWVTLKKWPANVPLPESKRESDWMDYLPSRYRGFF